MTNETDEPQEQSWQPPSDYSQKSEGEPPANSAEQASAEIPPAVENRNGSGQYAGRASAFGTTGPGFAPQAFSLAPKPGIIPLRPLGVMEIISALNRVHGMTILMVLHDMAHAMQYADDIVLMRHGEIVATGTPADVLTEERIADVFGVRVEIFTNSLGVRVPSPVSLV